jgi:LacI family transcriptional regulator
VLPPVRSIGIITAYSQKYAAADDFFQTVLKGVRASLQAPAKLMEVYHPEGGSVGLDDLPAVDVEAAKRSVQGFISIEVTSTRGLNDLVRAGIPVAAVDFVAPDSQFDVISIDHQQSGFMATSHLLELGHRRIAYVGEAMSPYSTDPAWQERLTGYLRAMAVRAGPTPPAWILDVRRQPSNVTRLLADFHRTHKPTAYVLAAGGFADAAVKVLRELGLECPRDYSLASADHSERMVENLRLAEAFANFEELGRTAVRLLASRLACRPMPVVRSIQAPLFIPGETTAPLRS